MDCKSDLGSLGVARGTWQQVMVEAASWASAVRGPFAGRALAGGLGCCSGWCLLLCLEFSQQDQALLLILFEVTFEVFQASIGKSWLLIRTCRF